MSSLRTLKCHMYSRVSCLSHLPDVSTHAERPEELRAHDRHVLCQSSSDVRPWKHFTVCDSDSETRRVSDVSHELRLYHDGIYART